MPKNVTQTSDHPKSCIIKHRSCYLYHAVVGPTNSRACGHQRVCLFQDAITLLLYWEA